MINYHCAICIYKHELVLCILFNSHKVNIIYRHQYKGGRIVHNALNIQSQANNSSYNSLSSRK